jgi:GNAT superfamily N-acetyltransferase
MQQRHPSYHFNAAYREEGRLGDGSGVLLRLIRPSDKEVLRRSFERLSATSRYLRFFAAKSTLTDKELHQLVNIDGVDHFALVAVSLPGPGPEEGLGVARFVRLEDRPEVAEPAVTVLDHAQGRGLATLLVTRLAAAARERGVERFACEFLAVNQPIRHLLEKYARDATFEYEGDVVRAEVPVPAVPTTGEPSSWDLQDVMFRLLGDSARGAIEIRLRHLLLKKRQKKP